MPRHAVADSILRAIMKWGMVGIISAQPATLGSAIRFWAGAGRAGFSWPRSLRSSCQLFLLLFTSAIRFSRSATNFSCHSDRNRMMNEAIHSTEWRNLLSRCGIRAAGQQQFITAEQTAEKITNAFMTVEKRPFR